ncbi:MAG: Uncharacterized protein LiPW16_372 [Microgenomates group bacterium LiPW_16]|nr:MAG: Uncharacterized protein LiPW16_372 [Microgenomates group bacterium LiPW_16]
MRKFSLGYTLIELMVVISIIGLLVGIGVAQYNEFNKNQTLKQAALTLKNNLRQTQNKALSGEKPTSGCTASLSGHKLTFTDNRNYKIVASCGVDLDVLTGLTLGQNVSKSSGPNSILFKVLGQGAEAGTICLLGFGKRYKISVTVSGEIKDEGFVGTCP